MQTLNPIPAVVSVGCVTALQAMQTVTTTAFIVTSLTVIVLVSIVALIAVVKDAWTEEESFDLRSHNKAPIVQETTNATYCEWCSYGECTIVELSKAPIAKKAPRKPRKKKAAIEIVESQLIQQDFPKPNVSIFEPKAPTEEISFEDDVFMFLTGEKMCETQKTSDDMEELMELDFFQCVELDFLNGKKSKERCLEMELQGRFNHCESYRMSRHLAKCIDNVTQCLVTPDFDLVAAFEEMPY